MTEKCLYLFCVAKGTSDGNFDVKGIGGERVFTIADDELSAVVQECAAPFSAEDPKLVSEWILAHQAVVDIAWDKFETVIPFSFDTLVLAKEGKSAVENLKEWLARERKNLREKISGLKGKAEYGVQISWDAAVVAPRLTKNDAEIQALEKEIAEKSAGTAYLLRQKLEGLLKKRLEAAADVYFKEFHQKVKGCVEDLRVEKVRKEEPPRQMLANLSCLALKEPAARLGDELEKIGKIEGFFVRFTGPWPPYSFV